jgi:acetyl-CoA acyltransferase
LDPFFEIRPNLVFKVLKKTISTNLNSKYRSKRSNKNRQLISSSSNKKSFFFKRLGRQVVVVEGVRTPFQISRTGYKNLQAHDLARMAISSLLKKTQVDKDLLSQVIIGTTIQEINASNVAREAALRANLPETVHAHTVTSACISSLSAIDAAVNAIALGKADAIIAGGCETFSDVPIRLSRSLRAKLIELCKMKGVVNWLSWLCSLESTDFKLDIPAVKEFSTGELLGESAERLCIAFNITRQESDAYALRSHKLALDASASGKLLDRTPVRVPGAVNFVSEDNGIRVSNPEKLAAHKPCFLRPHGSVTPGNSSFFTDGAAAALLMAEETALTLGYKPKAYIRELVFVSQDPVDQLLLGPAYAIPKALSLAGLELSDIDVIELHEAFAGCTSSSTSPLQSLCKVRVAI